MIIQYDDVLDLLYFRIDDIKQEIINKRVSDEMVLDIGENNKIVGIEILDASKNINLNKILPIQQKNILQTAV